MTRSRRPRVILKCPANAYSGPHERIVEFSARVDGGQVGGLISLRVTENGLRVEVYRTDDAVEVIAPRRSTPSTTRVGSA